MVNINAEFCCRPTSMTLQTTSENSFVKKLKASGRSLVVFYGSQTGTGEEFAGRLAKEGLRYHMKGMVADPEECDMVSVFNMIIFVREYKVTSIDLKTIIYDVLK